MTLADRLRAKAARRVVVPVLLDSTADDERRVADARTLHLAALARKAPAEEIDTLAADLAAAEDAARAHTLDVEFQALAPADFERLVGASTDKAGDVDRDAALPALAAACAVDESLRDEALWAELIGSGTWSKGERDALYAALMFTLNYSAPPARAGKG